MDIKSGKGSRFKFLKSYITVEPVLVAIALPYCLLAICLQNVTLEKVGLSLQSEIESPNCIEFVLDSLSSFSKIW